MAIVIDAYQIPSTSNYLFYIISGTSGALFGYEWYLNDILVGTQSTYTLVSGSPGDRVYVKIVAYPSYWYDGDFYGGEFTGVFSGGTFHYGILNGIEYNKQEINSKKFITKI
jgi:hypothetical protein